LSDDIKKRRFPKALADRVSRALDGVRDLEPDYWLELLARYRRHRSRFIAKNGATVLTSRKPEPPDEIELIPTDYLDAIARLDEAFQALHEYRNGGADLYISRDVNKYLQSLRAQHPRKSEFDHEAIAKYLIRRDYKNSNNKKEIIQAASSYFEAHPNTIRAQVSEFKTANYLR
jgi:hypothetical protein